MWLVGPTLVSALLLLFDAAAPLIYGGSSSSVKISTDNFRPVDAWYALMSTHIDVDQSLSLDREIYSALNGTGLDGAVFHS